MKKLLLTMACAAVFGFAQATEVTVDFTNPEALGVTKAAPNEATVSEGFTYQNIKVTIVQGQDLASNQELRFFTNASGVVDFRTSAKGGAKGHKFTVETVDGQNITSIVFDGKNLNVTAAPGTLDAKTWTGDAAAVTFTTTGAVNLNNMVVSYGGAADTRKPAGLSFPEEHYNVIMGEAFTAPVLTKETTATVTYSSDKETVATVDAATGAVTVVGVGTARITAKAEANDEYKSGEASYLLTVEDPAVANAIYSGLTDNADDWTIDNGTLPEGLTYIWSWDKSYKYLKASAYKGGNFASSATVTSPEIDLTGVTNAALSFSQVGNFFKGNMQTDVKVLVSVDGANFTELTVAPWPTADGWTPWVESTADLKAYEGKKIKVQFLYTSSTERAGTWEIKEFVVTGDKSQGVADVEVVEDAPAVYYNLQGVRVENPENGLYIKVQGKKSSKVYIK